MTDRTALVAGATGLVGRHLVERLLADDGYGHVVTVGRRALDRPAHPRLTQHVVDFDRLDDFRARLRADDVFCALGTTMRQAGSKEAFRRVDLDYPKRLARLTRLEGARQFLLVSALGANPDAWVFYSRVKGEAERAIGIEPFQGVYIFRPSLLLGDRDEQRTGEGLFERLLTPLSPLMIGPLAEMRPIEADTVAAAMIAVAKAAPGELRVFEARAMRRILRGGDDAYEALHMSPRGR